MLQILSENNLKSKGARCIARVLVSTNRVLKHLDVSGIENLSVFFLGVAASGFHVDLELIRFNPLRGSTPTAAALRKAARCMMEAGQSSWDPRLPIGGKPRSNTGQDGGLVLVCYEERLVVFFYKEYIK